MVAPASRGWAGVSDARGPVVGEDWMTARERRVWHFSLRTRTESQKCAVQRDLLKLLWLHARTLVAACGGKYFITYSYF